jgi:hypothetical protein
VRALSAEGLIEVWERGTQRTLPERALAFLGASLPGRKRGDLAALTVGERDAGLLALRDRSLGPDLRGRTECPECNSRLEFTLPIRDIYVADGSAPPAEGRFEQDGWSLRYRLPTAGDLTAATAASRRDVAVVRAELLRRTILEASHDGAPIPAPELLERLPEKIIAALGERMTAEDPQAEVELRLSCARCGHGWIAYLDICNFFWTETATMSERLLGEVHALARAYGWNQSEILAMSPARRQAYIERISE